MQFLRLYAAIPLTIAAMAGLSLPVRADDENGRIRAAVAKGEIIPLPRILTVARHHVHGEVLKVELEEMGSHLGYEVKILTPDGRVREVKLDARSGSLLAVEND